MGETFLECASCRDLIASMAGQHMDVVMEGLDRILAGGLGAALIRPLTDTSTSGDRIPEQYPPETERHLDVFRESPGCVADQSRHFLSVITWPETAGNVRYHHCTAAAYIRP